MIKEFQLGNEMEQPCLVRLQKVGTSSNGKPYAKGLLEDNSGCIPFICFETGPITRLRAMNGPSPYVIGGKVEANKYSNTMTLQVIVQKAVPAGEHDDISNLLPKGNIDREQLQTEFNTFIARVQDEGLHTLLKTIYSGALYERFIRNPAGMRLHHAYVGGLLHHTVSMTKLAVAMARAIGGVDMDLVIAGALLHDLGKIREISADLGFPYTTEGRLMGHIAMGAMMVSQVSAKIPSLSIEKKEHLLHIILAHHGDKEKGSPVFCATKEAFIVHYADELDSIMNQFHEKEGNDPWEYDKMLQRYLYKGESGKI
jgi:3'-5' exoribonuclease